MAVQSSDSSLSQTPAESPTVDELPQEHVELPRGGFWQSPFAQNVLPFLGSLALHLGLIVLVWATYEGIKVAYQVVREQIIIPDSTIVEGAPVGGVMNPGLGEDPNRSAQQDQYADVPAGSQGWASKPSETLTNNLMNEGGKDGKSADSMIGLGSGAGRGKGLGDDSGLGGGPGADGGPMAPFGVPGGGQGLGPKSQFMGLSGNATRIAFVCDASGSMVDKFDALRIELRRSVEGLKPIQAFGIIFFQEQEAATLDAKLVMATAEHKKQAFEFLDQTTPHGGTEPIHGLKIAFDQGPQLIYLLTDGDFPDNQKVIDYIRQRNVGGKVKINTIAFVGRGEEYEKVLRQIADENHGSFRYVSDGDLR
ncbi:MAG: VWA domain-containing protein [Phycisphaerales bacterium]|jgi:hypothetical protein|nr:VWA domain-containing protein [Phycisphaerales bacterium]